MPEVIISENISNNVDTKKIIESISVINARIEESKLTAVGLIKGVNDTAKLLKKAKDDDSFKRKFLGWKSETLFEFIIESNNTTHSSVSLISKLIQNNNDNSKLLAEMISKLVMLTGLSFEKISETTAELEEIAKNLDQTSGVSSQQANQIRQVIISQINKIKEEKNRADKIESNFGFINEDIKKLQDLINSKSEDHFIKIQNKHRKLINYLVVFSIVSFLMSISFIIYFFLVKF